MEHAEKAGNAQQEGVTIALELIEKIKKFKGQGVHGLHIMAVGWEDIVPRIVTEAGLTTAVPAVPESDAEKVIA
jgi:methylenetetrahydrofolate reductase (NADPH)